MNNIGIYIHIPFCMQKCFYCDFISFCKKKEYELRYVEALKKEIVSKSNNKIHVDTIYIGGGTPSVISEDLIYEILDNVRNSFTIEDDAEITIEANSRYNNNGKTN